MHLPNDYTISNYLVVESFNIKTICNKIDRDKKVSFGKNNLSKNLFVS